MKKLAFQSEIFEEIRVWRSWSSATGVRRIQIDLSSDRGLLANVPFMSMIFPSYKAPFSLGKIATLDYQRSAYAYPIEGENLLVCFLFGGPTWAWLLQIALKNIGLHVDCRLPAWRQPFLRLSSTGIHQNPWLHHDLPPLTLLFQGIPHFWTPVLQANCLRHRASKVNLDLCHPLL